MGKTRERTESIFDFSPLAFGFELATPSLPCCLRRRPFLFARGLLGLFQTNPGKFLFLTPAQSAAVAAENCSGQVVRNVTKYHKGRHPLSTREFSELDTQLEINYLPAHLRPCSIRCNQSMRGTAVSSLDSLAPRRDFVPWGRLAPSQPVSPSVIQPVNVLQLTSLHGLLNNGAPTQQ